MSRPHFNEAVTFDDPRPEGDWVPSPLQIAKWSAILRAESQKSPPDSSTDEWQPDENDGTSEAESSQNPAALTSTPPTAASKCSSRTCR